MQMLKVVKYDLHMTDDSDCKRIILQMAVIQQMKTTFKNVQD